MKEIILDFDNTMGIEGCDVDDFLALLYLLGNAELCNVRALCTSFGNSSIEDVYPNTRRLVDELGLDMPVFKGAGCAGDANTDAARFLANETAAHPGLYHILVTGSTTNLYGAWIHDRSFFENVASITFMGGITQSIVINGRIMDELNFSCDPHSTYIALSSGPSGSRRSSAHSASSSSARPSKLSGSLDSVGTDLTIATAQNCMPAFVTAESFSKTFSSKSWLTQNIEYWYGNMDERFGWKGFVVWDQIAAAALIKPELFTPHDMSITLDERFFSIGYLEQAPEEAPSSIVHVPEISNPDVLISDALSSWKRACESLRLPL